MEQRSAAAMQIVYRYMAMSAGASLIPVAGADVVVLAGIHVALIKQICDHYQVDFSEHTARNILIAVVGSILPGTAGSLIGQRVLRMLPWTGALVGQTLIAAGSAAFSYGIGRLFIHHFESGGTLHTFDVSRLHDVRRHIVGRLPSSEPA